MLEKLKVYFKMCLCLGLYRPEKDMEGVAFEIGDKSIRFWQTDIGNSGDGKDTNPRTVEIDIKFILKVI